MPLLVDGGSIRLLDLANTTGDTIVVSKNAYIAGTSQRKCARRFAIRSGSGSAIRLYNSGWLTQKRQGIGFRDLKGQNT